MGRMRFQAVSQHVLFALIVAGEVRSLRAAKQHASKQPEKVRQWSARSASKSKVTCGNSAKSFSLVSQVLCGLLLELDGLLM